MPSAERDDGAPEAPERTADGHHIVVDGRRWRATDPGIPEGFRKELVHELSSARRAVGQAKRAGDDEALAAARARVHDAKVALGERGHPWWEASSADERAPRFEATIRALLAARGPEKSICPSDVARSVGGEGWRGVMDEAREAAREAARRGEVRLTAGSDELDPDGPLRGPIRIRLP